MKNIWFECSIRYEKTMESGMNKKVTEKYLIDALSFTEAEARIIEEITPFISGEFTVVDINRNRNCITRIIIYKAISSSSFNYYVIVATEIAIIKQSKRLH